MIRSWRRMAILVLAMVPEPTWEQVGARARVLVEMTLASSASSRLTLILTFRIVHRTDEREAIEKWIATKFTSPLTGNGLMHGYLSDNIALRSIIEQYVDECAESRDGAVSVAA